KVSNWTRPVGSDGPAEDDWTLVAEYRLFDYAPTNQRTLANGTVECPNVYIPQKGDSVRICLTKGALGDRQSGDIIRPDPSVLCVNYPNCLADSALILGSTQREGRLRYPVGRYRYVDRQVKNGFLYFYSVSAEDSTGEGQTKVELNGRR